VPDGVCAAGSAGLEVLVVEWLICAVDRASTMLQIDRGGQQDL